MRFTLISPRLAVQKGDFLGSGVPYWPIELATFAAFLREHGESVQVLDLFGADTGRLSDCGDHFLQGRPLSDYLATDEVCKADVFVLYAISYMSHRELLGIVGTLRQARPEVRVCVLENSQAVTAYSLPRMGTPFFDAGADFLLCGEPYFNWPEIRAAIADPAAAPPPNVLTLRAARLPDRITVKDPPRYPVPAWDLFNLEGYWSIPYSHGPKSGRFLPVLTSRGCPYPCDFCVVPETNDKRWRANAPEDVVDEILFLRDRFGVRHFQVEDLNPTVNSHRWDRIAELLVQRNADISYYFVSGTKAETVPLESVPLWAKAGCRYISISPESGSDRLMKVIGKRFDYDYGLKLIATCRKHDIRTQACLLVGHPSEKEADFDRSKEYLRQMVRAGLDEVAVFVVAPFAGSALFAQNRIMLKSQDVLPSFSPKGRPEYLTLLERRRALIRIFFVEKLRKGTDLWLQGFRAVFGRPQTKMENLPKRVVFILVRVWLARWREKRA